MHFVFVCWVRQVDRVVLDPSPFGSPNPKATDFDGVTFEADMHVPPVHSGFLVAADAYPTMGL